MSTEVITQQGVLEVASEGSSINVTNTSTVLSTTDSISSVTELEKDYIVATVEGDVSVVQLDSGSTIDIT